MQFDQNENMSSSRKSFETLIKLIQETNDKYKIYLAHASIKNNKEFDSIASKDEIQQKISKCEQEYDKMVSNNVAIISQNNNIVSLTYDMNDIKQIIENKLITIKTTKYNDQFIKKFENINFSRYSMRQFDLKYTKLLDENIVCDNELGVNGANLQATKKKAAFDARNNFYRSLIDDAAARSADIQILQFNTWEKGEIAKLSDLHVLQTRDVKDVLFEQIASYYYDANKTILIQMFGVLASHVGICHEDDWNELINIARKSSYTSPNKNGKNKHKHDALGAFLGLDKDSSDDDDDLGINFVSGFGDGGYTDNYLYDQNDTYGIGDSDVDDNLVGHKFEDQFTMYNIEMMVDDFGALIDQKTGKITNNGAIEVVKKLRDASHVRSDDDCVIYFEGLTWDDFERLLRRCPHGIWMRVINPFDFEYAIQEIRKHVQRHVTPKKLDRILKHLGAEFAISDLVEQSIIEAGLTPNPTIDLEFWFRKVLYFGKQTGACETVVNELMNISAKYSKDSDLLDSDDDTFDSKSKLQGLF